MGCWHGWHGCGPWYGPLYDRTWSGPADWYDEEEPLVRRRSRRLRPLSREAATEELQARLDGLRDEMRRLEAELTTLRGGDEALAEGP